MVVDYGMTEYCEFCGSEDVEYYLAEEVDGFLLNQLVVRKLCVLQKIENMDNELLELEEQIDEKLKSTFHVNT